MDNPGPVVAVCSGCDIKWERWYDLRPGHRCPLCGWDLISPLAWRIRQAADRAWWWLQRRVLRREEMDGDGVCFHVYLTRWRLLRGRNWAVYLHRFSGSDWSQDLHDHPKRFVSIGVRGRYVEHSDQGAREYRAPWVRSFPAEHRHRIEVRPGERCWTIALVGRTVRPWGFWMDGRWIWWRRYVREHGRERRAC